MATDPMKRPRSVWRFRLWIGYWVALLVAAHVPVAGRGAIPIRHGDKILHFGLYFLLTWLGGRYVLAASRRSALVILLVWAAVYAAYGVADEGLQQFVGRTTSLSDWWADLAGIVAATAVLLLGRRSSALSEHGGRRGS